jgi:hypothetical protein
MFGFFKKAPGPTKLRSNPGIGTEAKMAMSNGERSWSEAINVVDLAAAALEKQGHRVAHRKTWLEHTESGFTLLPQLVGVQPLDDGGMHTVTTMQSHHPTLIPTGIFEYQHSAGNDVKVAIANGLEQWVQTDFVPLLEALQTQPQSCMQMQMEFPAKDGKSARVRRAILGPIAHYAQEPIDPKTHAPDDHPFCPCCMLTKSFEAFRQFIEGDDFFALRMFAARDKTGEANADCRVNGDDYNPGMAALRQYASTWVPAGYEFRKQYVVLHTLKKDG